MKIVKLSIISLILAMFVSSCVNILEEHPKAIATETFYNTEAEIEAALNGIYPPLHANAFRVQYTLFTESLSDFLYARGSYANINEYQGFNSANIANMNSLWSTIYLSIRNANIVIGNAPNASKTSEVKIREYVGEAKFMRAFSYFSLIRVWGGVPLRTEENMGMIDVPRTPVDEVYKLIMNDLLYAEEYLPDAPRLLGTPSKWTAKTLLADVFLTCSEWEKAANKAKEVIDVNKYSLVNIQTPDDFYIIFGPDVLTSPEEIFYFKYNSQSGNPLMSFLHHPSDGYSPREGNYYTMYTTTDNVLYTNWDDRDMRKQFNFYKWDIGIGDNSLLTKKYIAPNATSGGSPTDIPIYRYADVLLIYAEASNNYNGGPTAEAVECLNKVHRRAYGFNPNETSEVDVKINDHDKNSFFELVLLEKGYETIMEAKRWLDLVRTGKAEEYIKNVDGITLDTNMLLWPIPINETNYNKAIDPVKDQNPGY